jgi:hypothetical protein
VDCRGGVTSIGTVATNLEGGMVVAPRTFGAFGGQLIVANEGDGSIYAVSSQGQLSTVIASGVPAGPDIGVESLGFVPRTNATAYLADRGSPPSAAPHPGTTTSFDSTPPPWQPRASSVATSSPQAKAPQPHSRSDAPNTATSP